MANVSRWGPLPQAQVQQQLSNTTQIRCQSYAPCRPARAVRARLITRSVNQQQPWQQQQQHQHCSCAIVAKLDYVVVFHLF